jgi:predicted SprT family Zn-dependent metalloprotease
MENRPTKEQFENFSKIYDYFNEKLFYGNLKSCFLNFSRKGSAVNGFFAPERWYKGDFVTHEISLNPLALGKRDFKWLCGVVVHEMCHLWQHDNGTTSRNGYHNAEWGKKMIEVGLMPSQTGQPGGKMKGQQMDHYIITGGKYDIAFNDMPKDLLLPWQSVESLLLKGEIGEDVPEELKALMEKQEDETEKKSSKNKIKYTCACENNIWGKPDLDITCNECGEQFEECD